MKKIIRAWRRAISQGYVPPAFTSKTLLPEMVEMVSHECGHPVGVTPESEKAIGDDSSLLEEAKATSIGILSNCRLQGPTGHLAIIAYMLGRLCRVLNHNTLSNATVANYVRETVAIATVLNEAGVLSLTDQGFAVDLKAAAGNDWVGKLTGFAGFIIAAYQAGDREALHRLTERYANREHPFISRAILWINDPKNAQTEKAA